MSDLGQAFFLLPLNLVRLPYKLLGGLLSRWLPKRDVVKRRLRDISIPVAGIDKKEIQSLLFALKQGRRTLDDDMVSELWLKAVVLCQVRGCMCKYGNFTLHHGRVSNATSVSCVACPLRTPRQS